MYIRMRKLELEVYIHHSTNTRIRNPNDDIVRLFDLRNWSFLVFCLAWSVEEEGGVLHGGY